MIPFFVVDRPMSLNILKTSFIRFPSLTFGLMTHACVSKNFLKLFAQFPCHPDKCWLDDAMGNCQLTPASDSPLCALGTSIQPRIVRMCDSGIFEKASRGLTYKELFSIYEEAGADYGIMKDVLCDSEKTIESAKAALKEYRRKTWRFKLVLVAQGKTVEEYVSCYRRLRRMGGEHIAVGGLLRRRARSVRYMYVSSDMSRRVLAAIKELFAPEWLFVLGAYHPSRHDLFDRYGVFGSDYKGWIFQYEHRRDRIARIHKDLSELEDEQLKCRGLLNSRTERDHLAQLERNRRLNYIATKNSSKVNSIKKAKVRKRLQGVHAHLCDADTSLLAARMELASRNGLPKRYKRVLTDLRSAIRMSDQQVRVEGVHKYLAARVFPQCGVVGS